MDNWHMRIYAHLIAIALLASIGASSFGQVHPVTPGPNGPSMTGGKSETEALVKLAKLEKQYKAAKAAYTKNPKKASLKKQYVDSTVVFGHESMTSPALPPRVKYRQALRLYREALKLDPTNPIAKPEFDLMVNIYKQMGRPVPQ